MRKTFFVVMFFAILNFEILFLVFSFFVNLYFSSRGTCAEEKCEFMKNDFSARNKILKFKIAKNMKTKNVLRVFFTFLLILFSRHLYPTRFNNDVICHVWKNKSAVERVTRHRGLPFKKKYIYIQITQKQSFYGEIIFCFCGFGVFGFSYGACAQAS